MPLLVVIVNYRTADLVIDCLRSLASEVAALPGTRVVVTDNASGDGSAEKIRAAIDGQGMAAWARVQPLERNGGFAYGNNAAIRGALGGPDAPELVMLLNPDTVARPGALTELVGFLRANPRAGIAGGRLEEPDGTPQCSAHWLPGPMSELEQGARTGPITRLLGRFRVSRGVSDTPHRCEWVSGASMMIRREVFERIGLLDEEYFLYFEEVDFCRRAVDAGYEIWFVPGSCVTHFEGSATGIAAARRRRAGYWYDSRRRYFVKSYGVLGLIAADALWLVGRTILRVRRLVGLGGSTAQDPLRFTRDIVLGDLGAVCSGKVWSIDRRVRPL
ncbi:MAG: glycosyltransferase family 2 protein [Phycisphaeraceae bacterium]|nr:glycosyltransferase family 2 protein [Phycisphaeraceae bacterium]